MPLLTVQTNQAVADAALDSLIREASRRVAEALGKPERYVMVILQPPAPMSFAGSREPSAYLELKSIGLPDSRSAELSAMLAELMESHLGIPPDRVYIEFASAPRHLWGWNGTTF